MKQHFPDIGVQEIQDQDALENGMLEVSSHHHPSFLLGATSPRDVWEGSPGKHSSPAELRSPIEVKGFAAPGRCGQGFREERSTEKKSSRNLC